MQDLGLRAPPSLAIAEGATTPTGAAGAVVWSTTTAKPLYWDGSKWAAFNSVTGFWAAQVATKTSDQTFSATALSEVGGLSIAMDANATYRVDAFITFQSAATTTGLNLGFTVPSGAVSRVEITVPVSSAAAASQLHRTFPSSTASQGSVVGTGVTATNSNHTARITGIVTNGSTAGVFAVHAATEVAASAVTVKSGSINVLQRIA